jgi:predicted Fe-Mo cluster-binding NifX family protein
MRIAIPTVNGKLCMHFGHCESFALVDADAGKKTIISTRIEEAPEHQPGLLPAWLAEKGATHIIAGGMGQRAQMLFAERGIQVTVGAPSEAPETIVRDFLEGTLKTGGNVCDH